MPDTLKMIYALAFINAFTGSAIMFICFCRTVVSSQKVLGRVRLKFILLGPASLGLGWSPFWGNLPGYAETAMLIAVLIGLLSETYQWYKGPPDTVCMDTMPGELYTAFAKSWLHAVLDKAKSIFKRNA